MNGQINPTTKALCMATSPCIVRHHSHIKLPSQMSSLCCGEQLPCSCLHFIADMKPVAKDNRQSKVKASILQ